MATEDLKMELMPDGSRLAEWIPTLKEVELQALKVYLRELGRFNKNLNLISASTVPKADAVHVADAVLAWRIICGLIPSGSTVSDFGSGNGIPGIICAALAPDLKFRVVDRDVRKLEFLKHAGASMGLKNVAFITRDIADLEDESVHFAVSRGFAPIGKSLLLSRKLMAPGGRFFMMKGEGWAREVADVPSQLFSVWNTQMVGQYSIPESNAEFVVIEARKK
ncbi:MAG: class I SAM-dependent methyltransferase [Bdellovibrionales bacterium]|nr:class I SAM-dependent methyltransferase [Bdellovibrionales bacterium]